MTARELAAYAAIFALAFAAIMLALCFPFLTFLLYHA